MIRSAKFLWIFCLFVGIANAQTTQPATKPSSDQATGTSKFLRYVDDQAGGGQLQTAIVTYKNKDGATVDLIAAIHIADPSYYWKLNKKFESYDALLYEMVRPKDMLPDPAKGGGDAGAPAGNLVWVSILQNFMKNTLQLSHQLDEVNYKQKNFVHADLDADTFFKMQEARGESIMSLMLQQMMKNMGKQQNGEEPDLAGLLMALQSADRGESSRQLKIVLAKQFMQMDEMMSGMDGPDGTVLVTERNKKALSVLKDQLAKGNKKIGIFYGAAHLSGMEKILTGEMGFEQVGEPNWRIAWDLADPKNRPEPAVIDPAR